MTDDDDDLGMKAHRAAVERLDGCFEALLDEGEYVNGSGPAESPACAPFCGCTTCIVREVLDVAWDAWEMDKRTDPSER